MLRYTLMFTAVLALAGPVRANTWADNLFDELSRDFGYVPRGQLLVHPFRIVNNTKSTIHIMNADHLRVSCGCTSARALQSTLAPGQETAVVAQMDSRRFPGFKEVTVYVQFDQPQFEEVRLIVRANAREDIRFAPDGLYFGKLKHGTAATAQMTVSFSGQPQMQIVDAKGESNYIQPKIQELRRDQGEVIYQISATLRNDTPEGKWFTDIWLTTNNAAMPRLRVPLTVEIDPPPAPAPSAIPPKPVAIAQQPVVPPAVVPPAAAPPAATPPGNPPAVTPSPATPPAAPPAVASPAATPPVTAPIAPPTTTPPAATPPAGAPAKIAVPNIALGQIKVGTEVERKVILRGAHPFRIISVQGADKEMIVHPTSSESKTVHVLTVTLHPSQAGQVSRTIRVQTDLQNSPDIEFNAQAQFLP